MRRAVNSYAVSRTLTIVDSLPEVASRAVAAVLAVPNYAWLAAMVVLFSALSVSTAMRSRGAEMEAMSRKVAVESRHADMTRQNEVIRTRTERIRNNPAAREVVVRERLRQVGPNEISVPVAR